MEWKADRLIIRDYTMEDLHSVHQYSSRNDVAQFMLWGPNEESDTIQFLTSCIAMQEESPRTGYELAVVLKESRELIGGCGIRVEGSNGEIGYCFHPDYWRQGFASEAAGVLVRFGFRELGLHRIYATCRPENLGSAGVMRKLGMSQEGHLREHQFSKGKWQDSLLFSILHHEFKG